MRIRFARVNDAKGIRSLCKAASGENDYLLYIFKEWFNPRQVVVAEEGSKIIGMVKGKPLIDGSLWLGAARVHPKFRGRGIVGQLTMHQVETASRRNVTKFRALVSQDNKASIHAIQKVGFKPALVVTVLSTERNEEDEKEEDRKVRHVDLKKMASGLKRERILPEDIRGSMVLKKMNGLVGMFYEFSTLNRTTADMISKNGQVYSFDGVGKFIFATNKSRTWMTTQVIVDHPSLPKRLAEVTLADDAPGTGLFLPIDKTLISRYKRGGFEYAGWAKRANVMQLEI